MVKLTRAEQETIISFSAADKDANIYSTDPIWIAKLKKLGGKMKGDYAIELSIPKSRISIRSGYKMSEEDKAIRAERLAKLRESKKRSLD